LTTKTKLTRRTAFRLAGLVAAIISTTNVIIFSVLFFVISQQLSQRSRSHINEIRKTLVEIDTASGFDALAAMVGRHAVVAESEEDIYLLTDKAGNYVAGNIRAVPRFEGWKTIDWKDLPLIENWTTPRTSTAVMATWTPTKNGYLLIGDGNGDIIDAQRLLLNGLLWGIGLSIVSAIVGGYILGLKAQARVEAMERVLDAVASGHLQERIPRSSSSDDIDHVAALINTTLDRLEALIGNLKQVSTDIAHDLRTPISRMRHKLEIAHMGPADLATCRLAIEEALEEIDAIADTFDALLRISEIEAGARRIKFVDVELKSLLANVVDALEAVAEEHGHSLTANLDATRAVNVPGDRRLLNQLFVNLIDNSIMHCPRGTDIRVELDEIDGQPVVRVRDTGPGIPPEAREKVFRRLYRLEKSRSTRGSGLGLSLVAAIADLHGAAIELKDNKPGLLTEIVFRKRRT
jgi:signal transduction histidine kinase